jgi:sugar transferase (PEP-CTERM system associated)
VDQPLSWAALRRQGIWGIVVARDPADTPTVPVNALLDCKLRGVPVFDEAGFCEQHLGRIDLDGVHADWLLFADGFASGRASNVAKRAFDICVSLALLLLTLPLMLLIAALVRIDSVGPVLYRQQRTGLHGRPFTLLKFRSMTMDAEQGGNPRWAIQQDPRITRVGSFIRPMRIDELPQLINVLRGEMSMIGPRPERPHFVEQLARIIPFYNERSYVKPGITGWAQVNYPYGASVEDARQKLSYDLYYVKNRSLLLDVLILIATIRVILFREGAR